MDCPFNTTQSQISLSLFRALLCEVLYARVRHNSRCTPSPRGSSFSLATPGLTIARLFPVPVRRAPRVPGQTFLHQCVTGGAAILTTAPYHMSWRPIFRLVVRKRVLLGEGHRPPGWSPSLLRGRRDPHCRDLLRDFCQAVAWMGTWWPRLIAGVSIPRNWCAVYVVVSGVDGVSRSRPAGGFPPSDGGSGAKMLVFFSVSRLFPVFR